MMVGSFDAVVKRCFYQIKTTLLMILYAVSDGILVGDLELL